MNYKQEIFDSWLNCGCPDRVPPLLSRIIDAIKLDQPALVLKHQNRQLE